MIFKARTLYQADSAVGGAPAPAVAPAPVAPLPSELPATTPPATPPAATPPATPALFDSAGLKLPENYQFSDGLKTFVDSNKLTTAQAQALIDRDVKLDKAQQEGQVTYLTKLRTDWAEAVKVDPEIGGSNYDTTMENLAAAKTIIQPALQAMLDQTGFGSHPEVVRFFNTLGAQLKSDKTVVSGSVGAPERPPTEVSFYPTMQQKK